MIGVRWFIIGIVLLIILYILLSKISLKVTFLYSEIEKQCLLQVKIWMIRYTFDVLERIEKQKKRLDKKLKKQKKRAALKIK